MPYKPFYDDWINVDNLFRSDKFLGEVAIPLPVNLDKEFFLNLRFDQDSFKQYRKEACLAAQEILGSKIALCLSGGVDSQYMVQCWKEAKLDFDVAVLVFNKDFNSHDVSVAREFAKKTGIRLKEVKIDVLNFLNRENYDYGITYHSASPHFNCHYKLFDILKSEGYTGVACGGNSPIRCNVKNSWGENYRRNIFNFINYTKISGFPCLGDFISFYPKLNWALSLITEPVKKTHFHEKYIGLSHVSTAELQQQRYQTKCEAYLRSGLEIIPQSNKFTGFELLKEYYKNLNNDDDDYAFEKKFRYPLEHKLNVAKYDGLLKFKEEVQETLDNILFQNIVFNKRKILPKNVIKKINTNIFKLD